MSESQKEETIWDVIMDIKEQNEQIERLLEERRLQEQQEKEQA